VQDDDDDAQDDDDDDDVQDDDQQERQTQLLQLTSSGLECQTQRLSLSLVAKLCPTLGMLCDSCSLTQGCVRLFPSTHNSLNQAQAVEGK
jgi:hypothetical protein